MRGGSSRSKWPPPRSGSSPSPRPAVSEADVRPASCSHQPHRLPRDHPAKVAVIVAQNHQRPAGKRHAAKLEGALGNAAPPLPCSMRRAATDTDASSLPSIPQATALPGAHRRGNIGIVHPGVGLDSRRETSLQRKRFEPVHHRDDSTRSRRRWCWNRCAQWLSVRARRSPASSWCRTPAWSPPGDPRAGGWGSGWCLLEWYVPERTARVDRYPMRGIRWWCGRIRTLAVPSSP